MGPSRRARVRPGASLTGVVASTELALFRVPAAGPLREDALEDARNEDDGASVHAGDVPRASIRAATDLEADVLTAVGPTYARAREAPFKAHVLRPSALATPSIGGEAIGGVAKALAPRLAVPVRPAAAAPSAKPGAPGPAPLLPCGHARPVPVAVAGPTIRGPSAGTKATVGVPVIVEAANLPRSVPGVATKSTAAAVAPAPTRAVEAMDGGLARGPTGASVTPARAVRPTRRIAVRHLEVIVIKIPGPQVVMGPLRRVQPPPVLRRAAIQAVGA